MFNAVAFGELSRRVFLAHAGGEVLIPSLVLLRQRNRVRFHPVGILHQEWLEAGIVYPWALRNCAIDQPDMIGR